jgi:serine/arginine repetitive matrix protein 2
MTPRDMPPDAEEQTRSHSTTPRATSPILPGSNGLTSSSLVTGSFRRDSNALSGHSPRPTSPASPSPLFLPRIPNGNFHAEVQRDGDSNESDTVFNPSILGRRRPASPLSGPTYQPMTVLPRPSTPSNITWTFPVANNAPKDQGGTNSVSSHSRSGSWVSDNGASAEIHSTLGRSKSAARSLRSPALLDSPLIDRGTPGWKSPPVVELGSPISTTSRTLRSPTPTQDAPRSPSPTTPSFEVSPSASPRTSKQNAPTSPFSLGPFQGLVFSPLANSSRSSLESAGSSYHSWDDERHKDRVFSLFNDNGTPQSIWHDLSTTDKSSSATPGGSQDESWDAEGIIARYAGLTKSDFVAIQEKLVGAANARTATPDVRERVPSLRRRRPSTSQSNYSLNGREAKVCNEISADT